MITYFPSVHPDELSYSWFARFRIHTGCFGFSTAAQLLYGRKLLHPSEEFINTVTDDVLQIITRNMTMSDIVSNHTMFPYYGRFVPKDRRSSAFNMLCKNQGYSKPILPIPVKQESEKKRYLRFCPVCSAEDRELYSEAYWHRIHQMQRIRICPIHYCQLIESGVEISSRPSPGLFTAEECIREAEAIYSENEVERELASYVMKVFLSDMDLDNEIQIGDYMQAKLELTKHVAMCSSRIKVERFAKEVNDYYTNVIGEEVGVPDHFRRLLENNRINTHEICMMAMYLGIPAEELVQMKLPSKNREQHLSNEIYRLSAQGYNYREISSRIDITYEATKKIAQRNKVNWPPMQQIGVWKKIDPERLKCVKEELKQIRYDSENRPVRITRKMVARLLGIDKQHLNKKNEHTLEFGKLYETPEQFWARKLAWAFGKCHNGYQFPYWSELRNVAGIDRGQGLRCLPYIKEMLDEERYDWVHTILISDDKAEKSPKAEMAKRIMLEHSKHFGGNMTNVAVMKMAGISKASFNRYRKELLEEMGQSSEKGISELRTRLLEKGYRDEDAFRIATCGLRARRWKGENDLSVKNWYRFGCPILNESGTYLPSLNHLSRTMEGGVSVIDSDWFIEHAPWTPEGKFEESGVWEIPGILIGIGSDYEPVIYPVGLARRTNIQTMEELWAVIHKNIEEEDIA